MTSSLFMALFRPSVDDPGFGPRECYHTGSSGPCQVDGRILTEIASLLLPYVLRGDFTLSSGASSTWYVDCRDLTYGTNGWKVAQAIYDVLNQDRVAFDAIGGVGYGGAAMAVLTAWRAGVPSFVVRTDPKDHGMGGWIAGPLRPKDKVVLLEDTISTGRSVMKAWGAINLVGAEVVRIICILNRSDTLATNYTMNGIPVTSLVTPTDLGLQ